MRGTSLKDMSKVCKVSISKIWSGMVVKWFLLKFREVSLRRANSTGTAVRRLSFKSSTLRLVNWEISGGTKQRQKREKKEG